MKKIFGLFFILALTLSLASCGECKEGEHTDQNGDGVCDKCDTYVGLVANTVCSHSDADGNGKCDECGGFLPSIANKSEWADAFNVQNAKFSITEQVYYSGQLYQNYTTDYYAADTLVYNGYGIEIAKVADLLEYYLMFDGSFDSFTFDTVSGVYKCKTVTVDGYDYSNVSATFDENKQLTKLSFEVADYYYTYVISLTVSNHNSTVKPVRDPFVATGEEYCDYFTTRNVEGHKLAYVTMTIKDYGDIKLLLDATTAPQTVMQILKLINDGFYDGLTFHRVIDEFMIQGGDPNADGSGDYKDADGNKVTIKGEFSSNGHENDIKHIRGVISMARGNDKDSASCQFFICNAKSDWLDGEYAAFGYVIDGMSVVDHITYDTFIYGDSNGSINDKDKQAVIEKIVIDELVGITIDEIIGEVDELPEDNADPEDPAEQTPAEEGSDTEE